jgi:hypothetical protein
MGGHGLSLVRSDDFGWLIKQYGSVEGTVKENLSRAIAHIDEPENIAHSDLSSACPVPPNRRVVHQLRSMFADCASGSARFRSVTHGKIGVGDGC